MVPSIKRCDPLKSQLLTPKDRRWLELTRRVALKSNFMKKQVGIILVRGNKILAEGFNKLSHPKILNYPGIDGLHYFSLHAEVAALASAVDVKKATAYLYAYKRSSQTSHPGNAKPCPLCEIYLRKRGINRAVFTTPFGGIGTEIYDN